MVYGVEKVNVSLVIFSGVVLFWSVGFLMYYIATRLRNATPFPEEDDDSEYDSWGLPEPDDWKKGIKKWDI